MRLNAILSVLPLLFFSSGAMAQVGADGVFTAEKICPANKKLTSDNPGNVMTEPGLDYQIVGLNKSAATHFLLIVPGAAITERRWVDIACGSNDIGIAAGSGPSAPGGKIALDSIENTLAASWQPGFCATGNGRKKIECKSQTAGRPDATQFSIHGLWPDDLDDKNIFPCYCDKGAPVSCTKSLGAVSSLALSAPVVSELQDLMPGFQSDLQLHEWSKHGTCYEDFNSGPQAGADPDEYFADTIALMHQLNDSAVRDLFVASLGQVIGLSEIEAAFDTAFGPGAGARVVLRCTRVSGENIITEMWIGLKGEIGPDSVMAELILAAPTRDVSSKDKSCQSGRVVKVE